jgi:eukaryotic-like serine/threonine-protein kinase
MGTRATAGAGRLDRVALPRRYEILHHVANGGMASVWCARDQVLGRTVAIKLLAESYSVGATAVRRFEREARAAARVSAHPNVATIYDIGTADGTPYIVMEYLAGGSVADALSATDEAGIDPRLAVRWVREAAAALDHAHSLGVVHRDVKPGNLLLDDAQRLHVADFGIARLVSEATITTGGELLGTAAYLAPEQALGHPATDATDRYSLAVAAYELLVGSRPFAGEAALAGRRQDGEDPPPASERNPALPRAVDTVLARGMAASPSRRWQSASEFATALATTLRGPERLRFADPEVRAPFVSYRARRQLPSRPVAALAVLAAIAFAAGIATGAGTGGTAHRAHSGALQSRAAPLGRAGSGRRRRPHLATHAAARSKPALVAQPAAPPASAPGTTTGSGPALSPTEIDIRGHQLMLGGDYAGSIAAMRRVLAATPADSLLHAYALFDLGRSLRLAGDPQAAIPVLEQRLQFPNQTGVVRAELALAERAAGVAPAPAPGHGQHGQQGHGHVDGGAGLGGGGPHGGPGGGSD